MKNQKLESTGIPSIETLSSELRSLLSSNEIKGKWLLIVDGLEQFDQRDFSYRLSWIPDKLASNIKIVLSCSDSIIPYRTIAKQNGYIEIITPRLEEAKRKKLISELPLLVAKTLDTDEIATLCRNKATVNPLFIRVAIEELKFVGSHKSLKSRIERLPAPSNELFDEEDMLKSLFNQVIDRIEDDFGVDIVKSTLCLLVCSRLGLSEEEIMALIDYRGDKEIIYFIIRQLEPYLGRECDSGMAKGLPVFIKSKALREAIEDRYMLYDTNNKRRYHQAIASYYSRFVHFNLGLYRTSPTLLHSEREVTEKPWHLANAANWNDLHSLLSNIDELLFLWHLVPEEVLSYWVQIESNTSYRMVDSYKRVCEDPSKYAKSNITTKDDAGNIKEEPGRYNKLVCIAELLEKRKYEDEAHAIWKYIAGWDDRPLSSTRAIIFLSVQIEAYIKCGIPDPENVILLCKKLLALSKESGDERGVPFALEVQAHLYAQLGRADVLDDLYKEAEHFYRERKDWKGLQKMWDNQVITYNNLNDINKMMDVIRMQASLYSEMKDSEGLKKVLLKKLTVSRKYKNIEYQIECIEEIEVLERSRGDQKELLKALFEKAKILEKKNEPNLALSIYEQIEASCREKKDNHGLAEALRRHGQLLYSDERTYSSAKDILVELLELYRKTNDLTKYNHLLVNVSNIYCHLGNHTKALSLLKEHELLSKKLNDNEQQAMSLGNQAMIYYEMRNYNKAMQVAKEAQRFCTIICYPKGVRASLYIQGAIHAALGKLIDAHKSFKEHEILCKQADDKEGLIRSLKAQAQLEQKDNDQVRVPD